MQETRVRSLVREDPTCPRAIGPVSHECWACALEPGSQTPEATRCGSWSARALEPVLCDERSPWNENPTRAPRLQYPWSLQLEKSLCSFLKTTKTQRTQNKLFFEKCLSSVLPGNHCSRQKKGKFWVWKWQQVHSLPGPQQEKCKSSLKECLLKPKPHA